MVLENHRAIGDGEVESISAHYHCHSCLYKDEVTFCLDCDISEWQLPEVVCVCGKKMTLWEGYSQDSISEYLNLINKLGHSSRLLAGTVEIVNDDRKGLSH